MQGWEDTSDHLFSQVDDTLQSALVLGSRCSAPDDNGGKDELNGGSVELHHYCLWQAEILQERTSTSSAWLLVIRELIFIRY